MITADRSGAERVNDGLRVDILRSRVLGECMIRVTHESTGISETCDRVRVPLHPTVRLLKAKVLIRLKHRDDPTK